MRPLRRQDSKVGSDPNIVALLSLQLLLLAFFILMTAISDFEQNKVQMVVGSVNEAFDGQIVTSEDVSLTDAALGPIPGSARLAARIRNLFSSTLPVARVERKNVPESCGSSCPRTACFAPISLSFRLDRPSCSVDWPAPSDRSGPRTSTFSSKS